MQRFLFSFGAHGDPVPRKWFDFYETFTVPFAQRLFELMLLTCGPSSEPRVFQTTPRQGAVLQDVETTTTNFKRKAGVDSNFQGSLPKAMYWIATSTLTNHLLQHALPAALEDCGDHSAPLRTVYIPDLVSDGSIATAHTFALRRYLFGQAVLARSASEQSCLGKDVPRAKPLLPDTELVCRLLRACTGPCIRQDDIVRADLDIERALRKGNEEAKSLAKRRIQHIWAQLAETRVGELELLAETTTFLKFAPRHLPQSARAWLADHRIPMQLWGLRYVEPVECETQEERLAGDSVAHPAPHPRQTPVVQRNASPPLPQVTAGPLSESQPPVPAFSSTAVAKPPTVAARQIVHCKSHAGPVWCLRQFKAESGNWLKSTNCRFHSTHPYVTDAYYGRTASWTSSKSCSLTWYIKYTLQSHDVPSGTLLVEARGSHNHEEKETASGKVWSPMAFDVAVDYVRATTTPTLRGLKARLVERNIEDVPLDAQMSSWLKRRRSCRGVAEHADMPAPTRVETTRATLESWAQTPQAERYRRLLYPPGISLGRKARLHSPLLRWPGFRDSSI